ncbi:MAG: hypothetical protein R3B70_29600 [Polyangiaceae bacterium]
MKTTGSLGTMMIALALAALAGCGGNVIVEASGGSGGAGGTGGGGTATTSPTTTQTTPAGYCDYACEKLTEVGCTDPTPGSCENGCLDAFNEYPGCTAELGELYTCLVDSITPACEAADPCSEELNAFSDCVGVNNGCGVEECAVGDDDSCYCGTSCEGSYLTADCGPKGAGYECWCWANDELIGTCVDTTLTCGVFDSCCGAAFFGD